MFNRGGFESECARGQTGILCTQCHNDGTTKFAPDARGRCTECADTTTAIYFFILAALIASAILYFLLRSTYKAGLEDKKSSNLSIVYKIIVNYFHTVTLIGSLNIQWPTSIQNFLNAQSRAGSVSETIISIECFLDPKRKLYSAQIKF